MQIPIFNGIYTEGNSDYRTSYPINMIPVPKDHGKSKGYLRPSYGLSILGEGPGIDRGGIYWNGLCYRVMGPKLIKVLPSGAWLEIGDVGGITPVRFAYSFDYLAVVSNGNMFLYDGVTLTQQTDPDLGTALDVVWVDGYFMTTDGEYLVVTELGNPFSVDPLKYGSAEADPDPIKALLKIRNEVYALNRYTIEVFDNIGGDLFPFSRIESAQIEKGTIGPYSNTEFMDMIAFLGSDRNEAPAIYLGYNSQTKKISTREIDQIIASYTTKELESVYMEEKIDSGHSHLLCHFPDQTWVYDGLSLTDFPVPIWFVLRSTLEPEKSSTSTYRARYHTRAYDKWIFGDPTSAKYGFLTEDNGDHLGDLVRWEFRTTILYNEGTGAVFHELELVGMPGKSALGIDSTIWTEYSADGAPWSVPRSVKVGKIGDTGRRLVWFKQGGMRKERIQKFFGTSDANLSVSRLEARIEGLRV